MKFLQKLDAAFEKVLDAITTILVIALMAIICLQVITRNLFAFNLGTLADYPVYLMIYAVWIGAILAARADDHLSIQFLDVFVKNEKVLKIVNIIMSIIVAVSFAIFAYYGFKQVGVLIKRNQVDPGTKLHIWVLQCIVPISSAFQALYYAVNTGKKIRGLAEK